jgi:hypothetical protein
MNFRFLLSALAVIGLMFTLHAADPTDSQPVDDAVPAKKESKHKKPAPTPKPGAPPHPGLFNRIFHTLHLSHDKDEERQKVAEAKLPNWHHIVLAMTVTPQPLKLSETHQVQVTLRLENKSKKFVQLEFPTSQRIEVVVKNKTSGKLVEHWSEDQAFSNDPGVVSINPGERVEYTATVSTRDLAAGETYTIEGFFPSYEALHSAVTVVPEK